MQVHSVECQLAQAQMNLYLAGDAMAEETMAELERHIAGCEACRNVLRVKKQSLQSMLKAVGAPDPVPATRHELRIEPKPREEIPEEAVPAALRPTNSPKVSNPLPKRNWKPIYYSGALALVLATMSFLGDPTRLFGGKSALPSKPKSESKTAERPPTGPSSAEAAVRASSEAPQDVLADVDAVPMSEGSERPAARYAVSVANQGDAAAPAEPRPSPAPATKSAAPRSAKSEPTAAAKPKPKPATKRGRPVRSVRRSAPTKRSSSGIPSGLRVYDESGRPVTVEKKR